MRIEDFVFVALFIVALLALAPLLGAYMARVYGGQRHPLSFLGPVERFIYRLLRIDPNFSMSAKEYLKSVLWVSGIALVLLFAMLLSQQFLPFNPKGLQGLSWHLALNTAVSFMTNTNWQAYAGESTMSPFVQAVGLGVQNFMSAAVGMSVAVVLMRAFANRAAGKQAAANSSAASSTAPGSGTAIALSTGSSANAGVPLGNFWVDMVRSTLYILLPLSIILAVFLIGQGVVQSFGDYANVQNAAGNEATIHTGPAASQIAIKQLGTNGGGYFGTNSAHPQENPTAWSNFWESLSILILPAAFPFMFGRGVGRKREGRMIFAVMFGVFAILLGAALYAEASNGTMEGKEMRFGIGPSALWAVATTVASNGSVNAMHDSLSPIAGAIAMFNMHLGEVIFGGVGSGLYGILLFVILTIFICGLMVGKSPEYLGLRVEGREVIYSLIGILLPSLLILGGTALAVLVPDGLGSRSNFGPHGLSQIMYALSSAAANNGSAFGGLSVNTPFYNTLLAIVMLLSRFAVIIPVILIAGRMAIKQPVAVNLGTLSTDSTQFGILLAFVIILVAGLNFLPMLMLGPFAEHSLMLQGVYF